MISELIKSIILHIKEAQKDRLSMVKRIYYGPVNNVSSVEYPAILFNLVDCKESVFSASFPIIEVKFGLYICSAILGDKEEAAIFAQSLFWNYSDEAPADRGLIPWLMYEAKRPKPWLIDSQGRIWKMTVNGPPRIYSDTVGPNIRGAVYIEISLQTKINAIK